MAATHNSDMEGGAMIHECPLCGDPMEWHDDEPEVGIVGHWVCDCGYAEAGDSEWRAAR